MLAKLTQFVKQFQYHLFLGVCILLISFISYNLGKINTDNKGELKITEAGLSTQAEANIYKASNPVEEGTPTSSPSSIVPRSTPKPLDMRVVVSKASTSKKYHYSWCSSWKKIKPENQVWYNTEADAISTGYTLAGNCTR